MDVKMLLQFRSLQMERADLEKRIKTLQAKLQEEKTQTDRVRGGNAGTQHYSVEGYERPYSDKKTALLRSLMRMEWLEAQLTKMLDLVETQIAAVPDARLRLILRWHYQDGLSWNRTAKRIGEGYTGDAVRIMATRYLKRQ